MRGGAHEGYRRFAASFHGRSGRNAACHSVRAVAEGTAAELPAPVVPRPGWGPWLITVVVLVLPEPMASKGKHYSSRPPWLVSLDLGPAATGLCMPLCSPDWPNLKAIFFFVFCSMPSDENAIFFVLLFLFCMLHANCLILMLHFLHFILLLGTFPSPVNKVSF